MEYLYAMGILVTLALGIWNLVQNHRFSRKTSFINTVTAQRVQWLEQIRQDVAKFVGLIHNWTRTARAEAYEEVLPEKNIIREMDRLHYVIQLRLNPDGKPDQEIVALLKRIPTLADYQNLDEMFEALDELTAATQEMLKAEWEKIKAEAKDGDLND